MNLLDISQLSSPSITRETALRILTSPDIMVDFFRKRLCTLFPETTVLEDCFAEIIRKRLGNRQVISYKLVFHSNGGSDKREQEIIAKRYADGAEGERAFQAMTALWEGGFTNGSDFKIVKPFCYFPDLKLFFQGKAQGKPLSEFINQGDPSILEQMKKAARWLLKLHNHNPIPDQIAAMHIGHTPFEMIGKQLADAYPKFTLRLEELVSAVGQKYSSFIDIDTLIVHGDFHPDNIFISPSGATVVNFDETHLSDPALDVGYFVAQTLIISFFAGRYLDSVKHETRTFLETYFTGMDSKKSKALDKRITVYVVRNIIESLHYIFYIFNKDESEGFGTLLSEAEKFIKAEKVSALFE